jgi:hypothetical protein
VSNEGALLSALREIEGADVVAQDFSLLTFSEQMHVIHNTSVLLGFHGAGIKSTHTKHRHTNKWTHTYSS